MTPRRQRGSAAPLITDDRSSNFPCAGLPSREVRSTFRDYAPGKIRTCDLCLRRAALYPLSYGRVAGFSVAGVSPTITSASSGTDVRR